MHQTTMTVRYMPLQATPTFYHIIDAASARCVGFATSAQIADEKIRILERRTLQ